VAGSGGGAVQQQIFVGSSTEARPYAECLISALTEHLDESIFTIVPWWDKSRWQNLATPLASLIKQVSEYDYAIFFFYPDQVVEIQDNTEFQTRDNVIFEFGFFLSTLGPDKTFVLRPDKSGPEFRVLSDLGHSSSMQTYKFAFNPTAVQPELAIEVDLPSIAEAAYDIANEIQTSATEREDDLADSGLAKKRLTRYITEYRLKLYRASDTRMLNAAGESIKDFLAFKAAATSREVKDAAEDLAIYFELIDDLLNIEQLAQRQRTKGDALMKEVWIFADSPLEFRDAAAHDEPGNPFSELLNTVIHNIQNEVAYYYFIAEDGAVDNIVEFLEARGVDKEFYQNIHLVKLDKMHFKTYFTVHIYEDRPKEIFMSAITKGRNDLLVKVHPEQRERIYGRLKKLRGLEFDRRGLKMSDFVYE
jgi:hypothetical protein